MRDTPFGSDMVDSFARDITDGCDEVLMGKQLEGSVPDGLPEHVSEAPTDPLILLHESSLPFVRYHPLITIASL